MTLDRSITAITKRLEKRWSWLVCLGRFFIGTEEEDENGKLYDRDGAEVEGSHEGRLSHTRQMPHTRPLD